MQNQRPSFWAQAAFGSICGNGAETILTMTPQPLDAGSSARINSTQLSAPAQFLISCSKLVSTHHCSWINCYTETGFHSISSNGLRFLEVSFSLILQAPYVYMELQTHTCASLAQSSTDAELFCLIYSKNIAQTQVYLFSPTIPFNLTPQYNIPLMFQAFYPLLLKWILDNPKMPLFLGC